MAGKLRLEKIAYSETDLMNAIKDALRARGLDCERFSGGRVLNGRGGKMFLAPTPWKGFPDILGWYPDGQMWAVEVKLPKKSSQLSTEQRVWLSRLVKNGCIAVVARSVEYAVTMIVAKQSGEEAV